MVFSFRRHTLPIKELRKVFFLFFRNFFVIRVDRLRQLGILPRCDRHTEICLIEVNLVSFISVFKSFLTSFQIQATEMSQESDGSTDPHGGKIDQLIQGLPDAELAGALLCKLKVTHRSCRDLRHILICSGRADSDTTFSQRRCN